MDAVSMAGYLFSRPMTADVAKRRLRHIKKTYAYVPVFLFFLFLTCFTGCGKEADRLYFDIEVEKKTFFDVAD